MAYAGTSGPDSRTSLRGSVSAAVRRAGPGIGGLTISQTKSNLGNGRSWTGRRNENLLRPGSSQGNQVHGATSVSVRVHSPTVIVPNQIRTLHNCLSC